MALLITHRDEIGNFPTQIGRIAGPPKIIEPFKQFINNHWHKDYGTELIRKYFHRSKYTFYTAENGWKHIKLLDNAIDL